MSGAVTNGDLAGSIKGNKFQWSVGTSPPGSPSDGDLWLYPGTGQSGVGGFYWMFIYDSSEATYKWKFVGGAPSTRWVTTDESFTDDGTAKDCATAGPTFTAPRAGDYIAKWNCSAYVASQSATARNMFANVLASSGTWDIGNGAGSSRPAYTIFIASSGGLGQELGSFDIIRGISASGTLKQQYGMTADSGTPHVRWRGLEVTPIRVI